MSASLHLRRLVPPLRPVALALAAALATPAHAADDAARDAAVDTSASASPVVAGGALLAVVGALTGSAGFAGALLADERLGDAAGTFEEREATQSTGRLYLGLATVGAAVCAAGVGLVLLNGGAFPGGAE